MLWAIEGADAQNGRDKRVTLEAPDQKSALHAARDQGVLVSSIKPMPASTAAATSTSADPVDYRHPTTPDLPPPPRAPAAVPTGPTMPRHFTALGEGAGNLRVLGWVIEIIGGICAVLGGLAVVFGFIAAMGLGGDGKLLMPSAFTFVVGVILIITGEAARLFGNVSLVLRDLAYREMHRQ